MPGRLKPPFEIRVECHAGYKADERPLRFFLVERCYEISEVLDQWCDPECAYFRVRADDGHLYVLRHSDKGQSDVWSLESFRRNETSSSLREPDSHTG